MLEATGVKILWDFNTLTGNEIEARRPDNEKKKGSGTSSTL